MKLKGLEIRQSIYVTSTLFQFPAACMRLRVFL